MKTIASVSSVVVVLMTALTLAFASPAHAAGGALELIKSTPESGNTRVPIENVGVKLFFNDDVTAGSVWDNNAKCFVLSDSAGQVVPTTAFRSEKEGEQGYILVLAQPTSPKEGQLGQLQQKSAYKLTISADLMAAGGATLGEDIAVGFQTMDVAANSRISMILMVVMMTAVIALMFVNNWRKMKAEAEAAALLKANPYKIAKERNISVDDAKALIEKAKEKNKKQLEKVGGKAPVPEEKKRAVPRIEAKPKKNTHKVKGPRPISAAGGKYKTGRAAEKARKAKAEAVRKAAATGQAHGSGAKKTSQGKGKKK